MRIYRYKHEYLLIKKRFAAAVPKATIDKCGAKENSEGIRFSLEQLSDAELTKVVDSVLSASRGISGIAAV